MIISKIQARVHHRLLQLRGIELSVFNPKFEQRWEESSDKDREELMKLVDTYDKEGVATWIRNHPAQEYGERTLKQLHEVAKKLHIVNYSRMSKPELLSAINRKELLV